MHILIVEDEQLAAEGLLAQIQRLRPNAQLLAHLTSVVDAVAWLSAQAQRPDLAFLDIQLGDGLSFDIHEQVPLDFPIIFTTAYDQYALRAFEWHSVDYLLKPVEPERLERALQKWERQTQPALQPGLWTELAGMLRQQPSYKDRFLVKAGDRLIPLPVSAIRYFFSQHKITWARLNTGKKHALNYPLDKLEEMLDPQQFFRINRSYLVHLDSISELVVLSSNRVKTKLVPGNEAQVVSRDKIASLKRWLNR